MAGILPQQRICKIAAAENASGEDHQCEQYNDQWACTSHGVGQQYSSSENVITSLFGVPGIYQLADFNVTIDFHPDRVGYVVLDHPNQCSQLEMVYPNPARISGGDYCIASMGLIANNLSEPSIDDNFNEGILVFLFSSSLVSLIHHRIHYQRGCKTWPHLI